MLSPYSTPRPNRLGQALRRIVVGIALILPLSAFNALEALFAPSADLWPRWEAHDPDATATVDHAAWDALLATYLQGDATGLNRFAYGRVSEADRTALRSYLDALAAVPISRYSRAEQRAYWLNLYNALTVQVILDHYPTDSILDIDISPGLFADGPWDKDLITVEGEEITLNDIEHRILRPIWDDPRIHYAVNCASVGCPNLQDMAFTATNSERLLEQGARSYINGPRGVRVENGDLIVSSIYVWFAEDFGRSDAQIIAHLKQYAEPDLAMALDGVSEIADHAYDWTLNGAP